MHLYFTSLYYLSFKTFYLFYITTVLHLIVIKILLIYNMTKPAKMTSVELSLSIKNHIKNVFDNYINAK